MSAVTEAWFLPFDQQVQCSVVRACRTGDNPTPSPRQGPTKILSIFRSSNSADSTSGWGALSHSRRSNGEGAMHEQEKYPRPNTRCSWYSSREPSSWGPVSAETGCILNATNLSPANDRSRGTWLVPLCGYDEWGACIDQRSPEYGRDRASLRLDTVDYAITECAVAEKLLEALSGSICGQLTLPMGRNMITAI
jgi:hypothetical protein